MIKPEPPFRVYRVTWEIQIDATSPEVAAERAREIQMDPGSTATVFSVRLDEGEPSDPVTVDLGEPVSTCGKCGDTYPDPDGDADCPRCHGGRRP